MLLPPTPRNQTNDFFFDCVTGIIKYSEHFVRIQNNLELIGNSISSSCLYGKRENIEMIGEISMAFEQHRHWPKSFILKKKHRYPNHVVE